MKSVIASGALGWVLLWSGAAMGQIGGNPAVGPIDGRQAVGPIDGGPGSVTDGGVSTVEVNGLQVSIAADPTLPGHRPVEGAIDPEDQPLRPTPPLSEQGVYDDFLDSRTSDFDNCAIWSPGGAAVKGWFVAEWTVRTDGHTEQLRLIRTTLGSPLIEACLLREIGQWRFPPPATDGQLVRHAFYFTSPARTDLLPPELPQ